jgi:hypothetical protein
VLLRSWITALGNGDGPELDALGVSSSTVYWANFLYREPTVPEAACETGLKPGSRHDGFPVEPLPRQWVNVFDRLDPVAGFAPSLAGDYQRAGSKVVRDMHEPNYGRWRHSISKYLGGVKLRTAVEELLGE